MKCLKGFEWRNKIEVDKIITLLSRHNFKIKWIHFQSFMRNHPTFWNIRIMPFCFAMLSEKISFLGMKIVFTRRTLTEATLQRWSIIKRCSKNMKQIYDKTPMSKSDFNKVAKQLYWNHTSAWVLSCKFAGYFQNIFS